jgi:hypothetical protein
MKASGTEEKTWIWSHTTITNLSLTKLPKTYDGEKTVSSTYVAQKSGYPSAKNWN